MCFYVPGRLGVSRASILALAFALLLAAVFTPVILLRVREASQRAHCAYNLSQIGIAFNLHLMACGHLADGGGDAVAARTWDGAEPARAPHQDWGWGYQLLPTLNQEPLWRRVQGKSDDKQLIRASGGEFVPLWLNRSDEEVRRTPSSFFFCPSRRKPLVAHGWAKLDYAGNGGLDVDSGIDGVMLRRRSAEPVTLETLSEAADWLRRPRGIPDGAAHTILVAEKAFDGTGYGDGLGYTAGFGPDTVRWALGPPVRDGTRLEEGLFGSAHSSGVNALFVDGAVRTIRFGVDKGVFRGLCLRADGLLSEPSAKGAGDLR